MKNFAKQSKDPELARKLVEQILSTATKSWKLMEVCGGQTNSIVRNGIDEALEGAVEFIHGPGCPVCVTPLEMIDKAVAISQLPNVMFYSYGDMLRVPGSECSLQVVKARTGNVDFVTDPTQLISIAQENPDKDIVFFAVGFETTAPAIALTLRQAKKVGVTNLYVLVSHVLVPPAMEVILSAQDNQVQGFLAAGHVCTVMGYSEYIPIADKYKVPVVVTGFELNDVLIGILKTVEMLEKKEYGVANEYARVVTQEGNLSAQNIVTEVFEIGNQSWRGIGEIPQSGLKLRDEYKEFDAENKFSVDNILTVENPKCIAAQVLMGTKKPHNCLLYGVTCNPDNPQGAPMVSDEGACAAYYHRDGGDR